MFQDQVLENTILGKFATLTTDFAAKLEFNLQLMYVGSVEPCRLDENLQKKNCWKELTLG